MHSQKKTLPAQTRNLASLYEGMFIAERMGRGEGHRSATDLCTLAKPYNMPGRETQGYRWL